MAYSCSDKAVIPWGGMLQMKRLFDKPGIREKLLELKFPDSVVFQRGSGLIAAPAEGSQYQMPDA